MGIQEVQNQSQAPAYHEKEESRSARRDFRRAFYRI